MVAEAVSVSRTGHFFGSRDLRSGVVVIAGGTPGWLRLSGLLRSDMCCC